MEDDTNRTVLAQFFSADGFATGPQLDLPLETTTEQLELLLNDLLAHVRLSPSLMAALPPPQRLLLVFLAFRTTTLHPSDPHVFFLFVQSKNII